MAETNQERAAGGRFAKKDKPATSTGFGESRIHAAPDGTFEDPHNGVVLTLGGLDLTPEQRHLIPYELTDQGRAAREQQIEANGGRAHTEVVRENIDIAGGYNAQGEYVPGLRMEVSADLEGKALRKFTDSLKEGIQPWEVEGNDMFADMKRQHARPGFRVKALSQKKAKDSLSLGGWKPVLKPNGDPVMVGNMIVGEMPEEAAKKRTQYFDRQAHDQMVASLDKVRDQQEQIASANRISRSARKHREEVDSGLTRFRGDAAEMEDRDFTPSIAEAPVTV